MQSIDYLASFPITGLRYNDPTIPVRASAQVFSPFIPGNARDSGTPGFHVVYTLENCCKEAVEVSLAGFMDNPLASALSDRRLSNELSQSDDVTTLFFDTAAKTDFPSGIGNMCFSVKGDDQSYITGTIKEYALPGNCRWETPRLNYMLLNIMQAFSGSGRLPNTKCKTDPTISLPTSAEIDAWFSTDLRMKINQLSSDALLARVISDAISHDANGRKYNDRDFLREVRNNLLDREGKPRLTWGTEHSRRAFSWLRGRRSRFASPSAGTFPII